MGVTGAALTTIISQAVSSTWCLIFLSGKKTNLRLKKEYLPLQSEIIVPCIMLGLATFIMQASESVIQVCFTSVLFYIQFRKALNVIRSKNPQDI
ncbi:MAG: hypothetical protein K6E30_07525 [Lachnospiraceae bacterium]|nr:hypothetical protein [Lachnospiraceae bacterium]